MTNTNVTTEPSDELWNEQKIKLRAKFPYLTDADLYYQKGKRDVMLNAVQIILGKTKDQLTQIIAEL